MSEVAESFVGKWKLVGPIENGAAALQAMGLDAARAEAASKAEVEMEWSVNGEEITQAVKTTAFGGRQRTTTFKLGQKFTETVFGNLALETTVTEEGQKLVRKAVGESKSYQSVVELRNGEMVETMTPESSPSISAVRKFKRMA